MERAPVASYALQQPSLIASLSNTYDDDEHENPHKKQQMSTNAYTNDNRPPLPPPRISNAINARLPAALHYPSMDPNRLGTKL